MFPHERSLVEKMSDKPFALVGVNSDKNLEELKQKNEAESITWRSFWCGEKGTGGEIPASYNVQGWPTLYVLDHEGVIRGKWLGNPGEETLDSLIEDLVKKAEAAQAGG